MQLEHLEARIRRLAEVARGLSLEASNFRKGDAPLLWTERQNYIDGILDAITGLEDARIALAKACTRLEEQATPCQAEKQDSLADPTKPRL